jgi:hypothetical protein
VTEVRALAEREAAADLLLGDLCCRAQVVQDRYDTEDDRGSLVLHDVMRTPHASVCVLAPCSQVDTLGILMARAGVEKHSDDDEAADAVRTLASDVQPGTLWHHGCRVNAVQYVCSSMHEASQRSCAQV